MDNSSSCSKSNDNARMHSPAADATSPHHAQMRRQDSGTNSDEQQHLPHHRGRLPFVPITGLGQQEVPLAAVLATTSGEGRGQQQQQDDLNPLAFGNANPTQALRNVLQTVVDLISDDEF